MASVVRRSLKRKGRVAELEGMRGDERGAGLSEYILRFVFLYKRRDLKHTVSMERSERKRRADLELKGVRAKLKKAQAKLNSLSFEERVLSQDREIDSLRKELAERGVIMPAGTYFIGDPMFLFDNDYAPLMHAREARYNPIVARFEVLGRELAMINFYGDGVFQDTEGIEYACDSGLIAAVKLPVVGGEIDGDGLKNLDESVSIGVVKYDGRHCGRIVRFEAPFVCKYVCRTVDIGDMVKFVREYEYE